MTAPAFGRIAVIGCGLIGGSLALAARAASAVHDAVGFDRDADAAARAVALGIVDRAASSIDDAVDGADLVVIATPVGAIDAVLDAVRVRLSPAAIVTDVASTKRTVVDAARRALGPAFARFVPAHPIAGGETHGPDAAQAGLFRDRRVLTTPTDATDALALARIEALWVACGARVDRIDATEHDRVLAAVSHLPHMLAYALVAQVAEAADADAKFALAGAGFRDFTRIAASSPAMWRDIALANRDALLDELDAYRGRLDRLREWIAAGDDMAIEALFARASEARGRWRP